MEREKREVENMEIERITKEKLKYDKNGVKLKIVDWGIEKLNKYAQPENYMFAEYMCLKKHFFFNDADLKAMLLKRIEFGFKINKTLSEHFKYIRFESDLLKLIKISVSKEILTPYTNIIPEQIINRIILMYSNALNTFPDILKLWENFILFCIDNQRIYKFRLYIAGWIRKYGGNPEIRAKTRRMWTVYYDAMQKLKKLRHTHSNSRKIAPHDLILLTQLQKEQYFDIMTDSFKENKLFTAVFRSPSRDPRSSELWKFFRRQCIVQDNTDKVFRVFSRALRSVSIAKKNSIPLWQILIQYCTISYEFQQRKLFGVYKYVMCQPDPVGEYFKAQFVSWLILKKQKLYTLDTPDKNDKYSKIYCRRVMTRTSAL